MFQKIKVVLLSIKKRGIFETLKIIYNELVYDMVNKVDTGNIIFLDNLEVVDGGNKKESIEYCPTNRVALEYVFNFLSKNYNLKEFNFIDFGCGKGRVLIEATKYGFKNIIGIEFTKELFAIASENIAKLNIKNCKLYNIDATKFNFKNINGGGKMIYYFYNPFVGKTFKKVIENIKSSKNSGLIVYVNPICKDVLKDFKEIDRFKDEVVIYEIV